MAVDLNVLKYIRAVYECDSITRAAQEMFVSQPYLSQIIKRFEQDTGVLLFDRSSHPIKITPAGMCFVQWSKSIEISEQNILKKAKLLANGTENVLTIISSRLRNIFVLPSVIKQLHVFAPDYRVILKTATSVDRRVSILMEREADVLLDMRPHAVSSDLVSKEIGCETPLLAVPSSHPLVSKNRCHQPVKLDQFSGHNFVSCRSEMLYYDILVNLCVSNGFSPKIVMEVPDIPSCCAAVAQGIGVSIVPDIVSKSSIFSDRLLYYQIQDCKETLPCYLTYYRELENTNIFSIFLRLLDEIFSEL